MVEAKVPNVWKPWVDDTPGKLEQIFGLETRSEEFNYDRLLRRVVREESQMSHMMKMLSENMDKITLWQKCLLTVNSTHYPRIPFEPAHACIVETQEENLQQRTKFEKAHIELCFQAATNQDGAAGLRGAMQRAELMNFLVRLVVQFRTIEQANGIDGLSLGETFGYVLHLYVDPIFENNPIL